MILRSIELYKSCNPKAVIHVVMDEPASCVYTNHPAIDKIISVANFNIADYDRFSFFNISYPCGSYEAANTGRLDKITKDRFTIFAEALGVGFDSQPPTIHVASAEIHAVRSEVFCTNRELFRKPLVGVVWRTNDVSRNYPHTELLVEYLLRKDISVILIDNEHTINGCFCTAGMEFWKIVALITQLDIVVGGDTGPMHIAAAMSIPTLWIFGPTDPLNRCYPYQNVDFIWKPCDIENPCWYNFCNQLSCLWDISPWSVGKRVKWTLKNKKDISTRHIGAGKRVLNRDIQPVITT